MTLRSSPRHLLDKRFVRRAFTRAARGYDDCAVLQTEVRQRLLQRLDYVRMQPNQIADIGCGTGRAALELGRRYRNARVLQFDLSEAMLQLARKRAPRLRIWRGMMQFLAGDAERLPLANACCDLLFSNLVLQWCNDLDAVLQEFRRVLRPGGLLLFSSFGPDTLMELRRCWEQVDANVHVSRFEDMHDVGDAMLRAGLAGPVMDAERITLTYDHLKGLMRDLKGIGAVNATAGRARGLTGKAHFAGVAKAYEQFRSDGRLPATYEVLYGHAWAPEVESRRPAHAEVDLSALRGRGPS